MASKCSIVKSFRAILLCLAFAAGMILLFGCTIKYSLSGASIQPDVKTLSVQYFQNRASLVQVGLSQKITDALIDKCKSQTNLGLTNSIGDVNFEGEITDYNTKPLTVGADAQAATNRFTISVKVKFTNALHPDYSYEQTFSRYEDYSSNLELNAVEAELTEKIVELLVEDIFNKAFANW
jgi:predicted porin